MNRYIKTDNDTLLNENKIVGVKMMNEKLEVCMMPSGCNGRGDTHTITKEKSPHSFFLLNRPPKLFITEQSISEQPITTITKTDTKTDTIEYFCN